MKRTTIQLTLEPLEDRYLLTIFTVTNTLATGPGSLAQAITDSNNNPAASGVNVIDFDIPGSGQQIIPTGQLSIVSGPNTPPQVIGNELPRIESPVTIDGFTQPGSSPNTLVQGDNAVTNIVLQGQSLVFEGQTYTTDGIRIDACNATIEGLTIENCTDAIAVYGGNSAGITYGDNTVIQGNNIISNQAGICIYQGTNTLIGGTTPAARNIVSANFNDGIEITDNGNGSTNLDATIEGNYIGTDASGTVADTDWVQHPGSWQQNGVHLQASGNLVTDNLISGNGVDGVCVSGGTDNIVSANLIGTDASGTKVLSNGDEGVELAGESTTGNFINGGNIISGNKVDGVGSTSSSSAANTIQGDYIGTDASGQLNLGNGRYGVYIFAGNGGNLIGSSAPGQDNTIAFNNAGGVYINASNGNLIDQNSIFSNNGLSIALNGSSNNFAVAPQLTSAVQESSSYVVSGILQANPGTYTLEFFANPNASAEGKLFLGRTVITTATGEASFRVTLPAMPGTFITATATDSGNNTSQFSNAVPITLPSHPNPVPITLPSHTNIAAIQKQLAIEVLLQAGYSQGQVAADWIEALVLSLRQTSPAATWHLLGEEMSWLSAVDVQTVLADYGVDNGSVDQLDNTLTLTLYDDPLFQTSAGHNLGTLTALLSLGAE